MSNTKNNVVVLRRRPTAGPSSDGPARALGNHFSLPELVLDPGTGLYGIVVDGVEVISRLDPVGLREKIRRGGR